MTKTTCLRMPEHESAQCYIERTIDTETGELIRETLVSYTTDVIIFDYKNNTVEVTGTYSATTRKHIGWFARLHGMNYYVFKHILEKANGLIDMNKLAYFA